MSCKNGVCTAAIAERSRAWILRHDGVDVRLNFSTSVDQDDVLDLLERMLSTGQLHPVPEKKPELPEFLG